MKEEIGDSNGSLILGLLGVAFVALKLTGYITWSWRWVTLPFWGGIAITIGLVLAVLILPLVLGIIARLFK